MIYLDEEAVRKVLEWDALIAAMERALTEFSRGALIHPVRNILTIEEGRRFLGIMPAVLGDVMGAKFVTFYPVNAQTGLPTHNATIVLYEKATGQPLAAMDGRLITEMRTAAVSAAITKYLASPSSRVLALLGSGVQAHAHFAALSRVRSFSEVRVWSRNAEHASGFAREHGVEVAESAAAAVRGADVVVTATAAREPILKGAWLKPGAHVNAVGSSRGDWRELDETRWRTSCSWIRAKQLQRKPETSSSRTRRSLPKSARSSPVRKHRRGRRPRSLSRSDSQSRTSRPRSLSSSAQKARRERPGSEICGMCRNIRHSTTSLRRRLKKRFEPRQYSSCASSAASRDRRRQTKLHSSVPSSE